MSEAADTRIAIITGGTSGIGLAVAIALAQRPGWLVYVLGSNEERGRKAASEHPDIIFHQGDASQYQDLAVAFHAIYSKHGRLDYMFANAGATESGDLLVKQPMGETFPPEPDTKIVDVNYKGVMYTSYLAIHYFRQSPGAGKDASLVITGSCGSLYPFGLTPMYSSTKHAVLGFMRCLAPRCREEGIRVNALCPGIVRTSLVTDDFWGMFQPEKFTPIELIVKVTLFLLDGEEVVDTNGKKISPSEVYGQTLETSGPNYYLREQPEWCDDIAKSIMTTSC